MNADVAQFEDARWKHAPQSLEFRHRAALSLIPAGTVLDLGCGDGLLLSLLASRGIEASGLDISPEAVKKCHAKGLAAAVHSFAEPIPHADRSFDTVVLLDVLEHVYDPLALLQEARRLARRSVVVSVPNFSSLPARVQVAAGRVPENNRPGKGHVYWFTHRVMRDMARRAGLRIDAMMMNTFAPCTAAPRFFTAISPSLFALSFVARLVP